MLAASDPKRVGSDLNRLLPKPRIDPVQLPQQRRPGEPVRDHAHSGGGGLALDLFGRALGRGVEVLPTRAQHLDLGLTGALDEIEAQESYLAIEKVRFPDRLDVQVKAPPELAYALVPKLILQPLVENVIKHSAGRSTGRVLIEIEARADNGDLLLQVQDTRSEDLSPRTAPSRNGAGLHNIEARLRALHEDAASLSAQALPMGFRVVIRLPLRMAP